MKTKLEVLEKYKVDPMIPNLLRAMDEYGRRQRMTGIENTRDLYKHKFRDGFILGFVGAAILTYTILVICTGKLF